MSALLAFLLTIFPRIIIAIAVKICTEKTVQLITEKLFILLLEKLCALTSNNIDDEIVIEIKARLENERSTSL